MLLTYMYFYIFNAIIFEDIEECAFKIFKKLKIKGVTDAHVPNRLSECCVDSRFVNRAGQCLDLASDKGPLLFSLFFRFSQKLPSTSFSQNLVSKIFTTI
jgi:hypothetical protein